MYEASDLFGLSMPSHHESAKIEVAKTVLPVFRPANEFVMIVHRAQIYWRGTISKETDEVCYLRYFIWGPIAAVGRLVFVDNVENFALHSDLLLVFGDLSPSSSPGKTPGKLYP